MGFSLSEFLNLNNKQKLDAQRQSAVLPSSPQRPNFTFKSTGKPATDKAENWQFMGTNPVSMPRVQMPQNVAPPNVARYSDGLGNSWMEDGDTGQRFPVPSTGIDQPFTPGNRPGRQPDPRGILPVQNQNSLRKIVRGYI
jgi:hypothetical protein